MNFAPDDVRKALWHFRKGGIRQFREWMRRSRAIDAGYTSRNFNSDVEKLLGLRLPTQDVGSYLRVGSTLNVAVILDDFSMKAWTPEWNVTAVSPESWARQLDENDFDLLFVESAWAGNGGDWSYHLTGSSAPRPVFANMVQSFRSKGIPAVFWNKEDPPHFDDFLDSAKLFDFVFTSDTRMIERYVDELGHDRVASLSFGAQPQFHNPIRPVNQDRRDVAFAGMYFSHKFPERREQMEVVLGGAMDISPKLPNGLDIFSRQQGGDQKYQFPEPYASYVVGSLPYDQMLTANKYYSVFLNVNSVVDSPSMCARRIFEITAAGTPVVSAPSSAIRNFFAPSEVLEVQTRGEAANAIRSLVRSPELRDRMVHLGQRRIWSEHSYAHRARQIENFVGLNSVEETAMSMSKRPMVSAVVSTIRPNQIEHVFTTLAAQRGVDVELILVTHGFTVDKKILDDLAVAYKVRDFQVFSMDAGESLGDCLNAAVAKANGDFITKMDDDDLYGANYLFDQVSALRFSGASIVGKQAHYMYLADSDATLLRFAEREHRFTNMVMGPTMLGHAEVFKMNPFASRSRGEDTQFLIDVLAAGGSIYSSDRFNFMQMRGVDGQAHTWGVSDAELTATGSIQWFGRNDHHVFF